MKIKKYNTIMVKETLILYIVSVIVILIFLSVSIYALYLFFEILYKMRKEKNNINNTPTVINPNSYETFC